MATELERLTVLIEANTKSYERSMQRLQSQTDKAIRGATKSVGSLDKALKSATATAKSFAGVLGIGFGAAQIKAMFEAVADLGDTADKIGITAEALQELNFQAEQTGSSAAAMTESLLQFSKRLGEARTGTGELYKLLKANGVALDDLAKMDVNEALRVFVDILGDAKDQSDALKMATIAGGKAATDWALTFAGGTEAMRAFADQAHRTAQIMTNETVESAKELDDKFKLVLGTINQIVKSGIVDAFSEIAEEIDRVIGVIDELQSLQARAASQPSPFNATPEEFESHHARTSRIDQAFEDTKKLAKNAELLAALQKKLSIAPGGDEGLGEPSVLPPPPSGKKSAATTERDRAAAAAGREKQQVAELVAELERERSLIGATNVERRISNELHAAGAAATEEDKNRIVALVTAMEAEQTALDELTDRMDTLRDAAGSALDAFAQSIQNAQGPLQALKAALVDILQTIVRIAEQRAIESLLGAAGGIGGGILGAGIGRLSGAAVAGAGGRSTHVVITAHPSPMLDLKIEQRATAAEQRAVARGPAVARNSSQRFGIP